MPFHVRTRSGLVACSLALALFSIAADDPSFLEKPEIAASRVRGQAAEVIAADSGADALAKGPAPSWIWGADPNKSYPLMKEFTGGSKSAWIKATADNKVTLYINDKKVATSDNWNEPIEVDVQSALKPGANWIKAVVENEGGPSGFAFLMALTMPDGSVRYVTSDETWGAILGGTLQPQKAKILARMGDAPWGNVFAESNLGSRSPRGVFEVPDGFQVEKLFSVPRETLGSWVSITFDDKGRLIASDQGDKGLCRITPSPIGSDQPTKVERLNIEISAAQGLLHAFGHLYISVNNPPHSGLYRATDTNGDDQYDKLEKLADFRGGGEHGPHSLRLSPDRKSIFVIAGNHTLPPEHINSSLVPRNWGEDHLLPRQWDANGHAAGILAPGGWVAKTDPDGKTWEIESIGYRNPFDMAFNADGELFVYDADMEWDYGMPWYRPTRVNHATPGSELGWRSGTGKWPAYYVDSLPAMVDIGPGSPVGVTFGYGTKFPAQYQKALFICDWTFGTMYAIHITPEGSTYKATKEEFLSRTPLPLTDNAVGPDGALYFTIGGRGTQSELYRVTYVGTESTAPAKAKDDKFAFNRAVRHLVEKDQHKVDDPAKAVDRVYPFVGNPDRFLRSSARVALEHQDVKLWQDKVLAEPEEEKLITGAVALARQGDRSLEPKLLEALDRLDFANLSETQQIELIRVYQLVFIRMGEPDSATLAKLAGKFDAFFPSKSEFLNRELATLLVYLKAPGIAGKLLKEMESGDKSAPEDMSELLARNPGYGGTIAQMMKNRPEATNIWYAFVLRNLKTGWTPAERQAYFRWLNKARGWSGGASYQGFINNIDKDAYENATDTERLAVEASGARKPPAIKELPKPKGPGHDWSLAELTGISEKAKTSRNFANGQRAFNAGRCVLCHRFAGEGGATGPDLTQAAGRFGFNDLVEATIEPSKVISDQYKASSIATTSGKVFTGRIVAESPEKLTILVDPEDSTKIVEVARKEVEENQPSKTSIMPEKLLNPLSEDEVLDLFAYILSRGDKNDPMFKKK